MTIAQGQRLIPVLPKTRPAKRVFRPVEIDDYFELLALHWRQAPQPPAAWHLLGNGNNGLDCSDSCPGGLVEQTTVMRIEASR